MPPRRRATSHTRHATLAALYASASPRLRATITLGALVSAAAKVLPLFVALRVAADDIHGATKIGLVGLVILAGFRVFSSGARVHAECDLHRAVTRALLEGDVLAEPTEQPLRTLFEPMFHARALIAEAVPDLVASLLAAVVVVPVLAMTLPARVILVSGLAVAVVLVALVALTRASSALQSRVWRAQEKVLDRVGFAIEGRLELVARGAEEAALASLDRSLDDYRGVARRGAWGAAVLGRAPLAAGLVTLVIVVLVDNSSRHAVTTAVLAQTLVLAACLPVALGIVMRANELVRLTTMVAPVLDVLSAPRRPELGRAGAPPPALPSTIAARDLTFSYGGKDGPPVLRGVSFEWQPGTALLVEGSNGAGKSTLMRLVLGLREAQSGSLTVGGADFSTLDLRVLRQRIAYLPQRPYLGEARSTVRSALRAVAADAPDSALTAALSRVGLEATLSSRPMDALDVPVGELSAGQRQRVALARLLVQDAAIYLLDEPDANLDHAGVSFVVEMVAELARRGRMVAVAAHTEQLSSVVGTRVVLVA